MTDSAATARAPAVPLVLCDPCMNVWSHQDTTGPWPKHWKGKDQSICGLVRIDGRLYRFLSRESRLSETAPAMQQSGRLSTSPGVDIPDAITAHAIGVVIGGPALTLFAARLDRRTLPLLLIGVFILGSLLSAIADGLGMFVVAGFVTGLP